MKIENVIAHKNQTKNKTKSNPENQMENIKLETIRLPLGKTVMTRGIALLAEYEESIYEQLAKVFARHAYGDWGDTRVEDWEMNNAACGIHGDEQNDRVLSVFHLLLANPDEGQDRKVKIYLITEYDRSVTTALLPSEY